MNVTEARELIGTATFLDVREPYEFAAGHLQGSLHIPIGQIAARVSELPDDRIVVVCQIGQRSGLVADYLASQGYDAHNLEGGIEAWTGAGLPLSTPDDKVVDGWARDLSGERLNPD